MVRLQSQTSKTRVVRHIYLIRHGQYHTQVKSDDGKRLTDLGSVRMAA